MADAIKDILLKINLDTKSVDAGIKALDGKFESLGGNVKTDTFKTLKQQIRDATNEAQNLGQQFGLNSQQFATAAKKVAELKDQFGDANKVIEKFNPDNKLQGLIGIASGAATAVQGIAGAFTLIGVNADTAQVAIAKLQGVMALTSAISSIDDIKNSFIGLQNVAKNFLNSLSKGELIGIAIAGVAALGVAIYALTQNTEDLTEKRKEEIDQLSYSSNEYKQAVSNVIELTTNIDLAKKGFLDKKTVLTQFNETFGSTIGYAKDLNEAEQILVKNADAYVKAALYKAAATASLAKAADLAVKQAEKQAKQGPITRLQAEEEVTKSKEYIDKLKDAGDAFNTKKSTEEYKALQAYKEEKVRELLGGTDYVAQKFYENLSKDFIKLKSDVESTFSPVKPAPKTTTKSTTPKVTGEEVVTSIKALDPKESIDVALEKGKNEMILNLRKDLNEKLKIDESDNAATAKYWSDKRIEDARNEFLEKERLAQLEVEVKRGLANNVSDILSNAAGIAGELTVEGKALAIASATINTYLAASDALKANYGPFGPLALAAKIAAVASTITLGVKQVKSIVNTKVPGKGGGSGAGSVPSISAGSITAPALNTTSLTQQVQDVRVTNQSGQSVVRAYITNEELRTNQDKQSFLNKLSSF